MNLKKQHLDFFLNFKARQLAREQKVSTKIKLAPRLFNIRHQHRDHSRTKYLKVASISQLKSCLVFPFPHTKLQLWCRRPCQTGLLGAIIGERRVVTCMERRERSSCLCLFVCFPFLLHLQSTKSGQMKTGKEKAE